MVILIEKEGRPLVIDCNGQRDPRGYCPIFGCRFCRSATNHWGNIKRNGKVIETVVSVTVSCIPHGQLYLF